MFISMETKVAEFLKSKHVTVPSQWLQEFINWFRQEAASLSRPVSEAEVFKGAYDQWLVADLRELCTSCLPPNLTDKKKVMLDGHFTLQVNSLRDISRPAYQQYLKLKGVNTSNSEVSADDSVVPSKVESNANRVLRLEVTDGTQNISAMEYQPMPFINLNMAPGTKILVFGKVMCRYGVLYLTKENICVLGGDVEELVQRNKQIKVLRNVLNLPEENETTCDNRINNQHVPTPRTEESEIGKLSSEKSTITTNRPASMESSTSSSVTTTANDENLAWNDMDDDDFVFDNDFDKMAACNKRKSSSLCTGSVLPRKKAGQTAANSSDDLRHSPLATVNKSSSRVETARESSSDNLLNDVFDDYDDFVFEDIVMDENPLVTKSMTVSSVRSKAPYEYLCHLPPLPATERRSIRVKAFILTLLSVIDCNKGQRWQLKAEITDGSAKLPVEFADEVISTLIGMTASEYFTLKQLSKGSEEARKRKDMKTSTTLHKWKKEADCKTCMKRFCSCVAQHYEDTSHGSDTQLHRTIHLCGATHARQTIVPLRCEVPCKSQIHHEMRRAGKQKQPRRQLQKPNRHGLNHTMNSWPSELSDLFEGPAGSD